MSRRGDSRDRRRPRRGDSRGRGPPPRRQDSRDRRPPQRRQDSRDRGKGRDQGRNRYESDRNRRRSRSRDRRDTGASSTGAAQVAIPAQPARVNPNSHPPPEMMPPSDPSQLQYPVQINAMTPGATEDNPEVEAFIFNEGLNERAAEVLRSKSKLIQEAVMARGPLALAANPSAACLQRVKMAQQNLKASGGVVATSSSVYNATLIEQFIIENQLDERAAGALREKTEEIQNYVLSRGSLLHERNPSVACLMRIKAGQKAQKEGGGVVLPWNHDGFIDKVQAFIKEEGIDPRAGALLIEKSREVQEQVMARGPLGKCDNPSAVCMLRIKDSEKSIKAQKDQIKQQENWSYDPLEAIKAQQMQMQEQQNHMR